MTRITSYRLVAEYFSERFGRKISTRPIVDIVTKVQMGIIKVTDEEIAAVAKSHPLAQRFVEKCPWMLNPRSKATLIDEAPSTPRKKAPQQKKAPVVSAAPVEPAGTAMKAPEAVAKAPKTTTPHRDSEISDEEAAEIDDLISQADDADE